MYNWFAQRANPYQPGAYESFGKAMRSWQWDVHNWARQEFTSAFTQGGFVSTAFAPSRKEMLKGIFRRGVKAGSPEHIRRLRAIGEVLPGARPEISKTIDKLSSTGARRSFGSKLMRSLGPVATLGFAAYSIFTEQGTVSDKIGAGAGSLAGGAGWAIGSKVGMGVGGAVGSVVPVVGYAIGAAAGFLIGGALGFSGVDTAIREVVGIPQRLVEREKRRRRLDWGVPNPAFYTRQAATMRQVSLQAMNRGYNTSRSALGQEGMFFHQ